MFAAAILAAPAPTYDLSFAAAPVSRVVAEIAKRSGEPLRVDAEVGREIVALRFRGTTTKDAMRRLAEGLDASWETEGSTIRLHRSAAQIAKEQRQFLESSRQALRSQYHPVAVGPFDPLKALQTRDELDKLRQEPWNSAIRKAASERYSAQDPLERFEDRLWASLSPKAFEGLGNGHIVYHSAPNRRQLPLTPEQRKMFAQYLDEDSQAPQPEIQTAPEFQGPAVNLEIILDVAPDSMALRFRLLNRSGFAVQARVKNYEAYWGIEPEVERDCSKLVLPGEDVPGSGAPLPDTVRSRLADTVRRDPLTPVAERLLKLSKLLDDDLFAVLGDDLLTSVQSYEQTADGLLSQLNYAGYSVQERAHSLQIVPRDRVSTRRFQVDRATLRDWLALHAPGRAPTLNDLFRFSPRFPLGSEPVATSTWTKAFGVEYTFEPMTRLMKRLPWNRPILFRQLPVNVRSELQRLVTTKGPGDFRDKNLGECGTGWEKWEDSTDGEPAIFEPGSTVRVEETNEPCFIDIAQPAFRITAQDLERYRIEVPHTIRIGTLHRVDLTVTLAGGKTYQDRVEAFEITRPLAKVEDLPPSLLSALKKSAAKEP